jgi:hypothetical protein
MKKRAPVIATLYYLQHLDDKSLVKKQNILRLALAYNKYFLKASFGALWADCACAVELDIKDIRKWDGNPSSIMKNIDGLKAAICNLDGSIPDWFLDIDAIKHHRSILNSHSAPYLKELPSDLALKIIEPTPPLKDTHGTSKDYIAQFDRIQRVIKKASKSRARLR